MKITTMGIDLAKNVFQVHGIAERGKAVLRKQLRRSQVAVFFGNLPPCLIGMEACAGAHYWARTLQCFWPHGATDGTAVCETVREDEQERCGRCRSDLRGGEPAEHAVCADQEHRATGHFIGASGAPGFCERRGLRAQSDRGLLGEFGLVIPQGIYNVAKRVPEILEDASNELPVPFRHLIDRLTQHLKELDRQVKEFEQEIIAWHRGSELSRKLEKIPGIGPLAASALVASIADARSFKNGRQVSAWLGLVPRQNSSGGKPTLLGMSKRGDAYLRTLLIHGARSAILSAKNKADNTQGWLTNLLKRATSEYCRCGTGQQERTHRVGDTRPWARV